MQNKTFKPRSNFFLALCVFLSVLFPTKFYLGQKVDYKISRISLEEGLSQSSVYAILQDSYGFMWFGTAEGLNRYDGYSFVIYRYDRNNKNTISDNWITALYEDKNKTLWIGTNGGGLNKYERNKNIFIHYQHNDKNPSSISNDVIYSIIEDKDGILWLGTNEGLNRFDRKSQKFICYKNDPANPRSIASNYINSIYEDNDGFLWIGTEDTGLSKFDKTKKAFTNYIYNPANPSGISGNFVWNIKEDPCDKNVLWIATYGGLNKFDKTKNRFLSLKHSTLDRNSLCGNDVRSFLIDSKETFWIGTDGSGLDKYDPRNNSFYHFVYEKYNDNSISKNKIISLYEDKSGIIWVGTRGGGINKIARYKFPLYRFLDSSLAQFSNSTIWAILKDHEGKVWLGTEDGLITLNREDGKYQIFRHQPGNPYSISDNSVTALFEDRKFNIWIGTTDGGLNKFNRKNNTFTTFRNRLNYKNTIPDDNVHAILEDKNGFLWLASRGGGVIKFDPAAGIFTTYKNNNSPNSLSHDRVNYLFEDRNENLWVCTSGGGINKFNRQTGKFAHYTYDPNDRNSLSDIYALSAMEDKNGNIWICTYDGGLNKFDVGTNKFTRFSKEEGLLCDVTYAVLEDEKGYIWISTNKGIFKFDPRKNTFKNYDVEDGLQSNEFNTGSFYKSTDGEMFFGGTNGFNSFYPSNIPDNKYFPPVVISNFKMFDRYESVNYNISNSRVINLRYNDNFFSFEFASLDFAAPGKNQYTYMLENFDGNWIKGGNDRIANYTNIEPGEYIFKVKGTNSDGNWSNNIASVKIIISPPYWNTWWFRLLVVISCVSLIYFLYKRRIRFFKTHSEALEKEIDERLKIENELIIAKEKAEESDKLKSNFLAQMSHEIRTPVNTILSFTSLLKEELGDNAGDDIRPNFAIIENGGKRLIRTIDMILNMSEIQAGKFEVDLKEIDIVEDVLNNLIGELHFNAKKKNLNLIFNCKAETTKIIGDKYSISQIFQNLIDNAIKYTEKGKVEINVHNRGMAQLAVEVKDTGIGMSKEYLANLFQPFSQEDTGYTRRFEGTGLGLSLVKRYIDILKAEIEVESTKGKGTKFTVIFHTIH